MRPQHSARAGPDVTSRVGIAAARPCRRTPRRSAGTRPSPAGRRRRAARRTRPAPAPAGSAAGRPRPRRPAALRQAAVAPVLHGIGELPPVRRPTGRDARPRRQGTQQVDRLATSVATSAPAAIAAPPPARRAHALRGRIGRRRRRRRTSGASTSLSKAGSVAGPAGGHSSGSSACSAASAPVRPVRRRDPAHQRGQVGVLQRALAGRPVRRQRSGHGEHGATTPGARSARRSTSATGPAAAPTRAPRTRPVVRRSRVDRPSSRMKADTGRVRHQQSAARR